MSEREPNAAWLAAYTLGIAHAHRGGSDDRHIRRLIRASRYDAELLTGASALLERHPFMDGDAARRARQLLAEAAAAISAHPVSRVRRMI